MDMTPKEIVSYLDEYIIGQFDAKKAIAIALRNRYRRLQLDKEMQEEVMPKNILMIGSTGVGKTEIARRLAKIMSLPFIKVEASKYTEVGFVGRDVESMVRDLVMASVNLVKTEHKVKNVDAIDAYVEKTIIEKLLPPLPKGASDEKKLDYEKSHKRMLEKLKNGELDDLSIEVEITSGNSDMSDSSLPPEIMKVQESFIKILGSGKDSIKKELKVRDAKETLKSEASEKLLDFDAIKVEALERAQNGGIICDLLPIVEGSDVNTKYGIVKTDHMLFISAGAFHVSKPSDLIPELQGRFPLRVELSSLTEDVLYQILTQAKNSLLRQYEALLKTENVKLTFEDDAIKAIAKIAQMTNDKTEDIGARRLHTVIEKVIEDISYTANEHSGESITVTKELVHERLDDIVEDEDSSRYIL